MAGEPFEPPAGFTLLDSRKYGKARIEILRSLVLAGPNGTWLLCERTGGCFAGVRFRGLSRRYLSGAVRTVPSQFRSLQSPWMEAVQGITSGYSGPPTPDDTNDRYDIDIPDQTWTSVGYDSDTTGGTDANILPCTHHDFSVTTDGSDLTAQIDAAGFFRAA